MQPLLQRVWTMSVGIPPPQSLTGRMSVGLEKSDFKNVHSWWAELFGQSLAIRRTVLSAAAGGAGFHVTLHPMTWNCRHWIMNRGAKMNPHPAHPYM